MIFKRHYIVLLFCFLLTLPVLGQEANETPDTAKVHSPKKAIILSAILPGAGQAYNRKFWKMPIVYAGLGTCIYFISSNNKSYNLYRDEYLNRLNGRPTNPDLVFYSDANLIDFQDTYRRWRDLSYMALAGIYILQIVDAAVDAHFYDWETKINEDLSLRLMPNADITTRSLGLKLSLKL